MEYCSTHWFFRYFHSWVRTHKVLKNWPHLNIFGMTREKKEKNREKEKKKEREREKEKERKREKEFMVVVNVDTCKRGCVECFSFLTYLGQTDRQTKREE
jgi:hypothetical protein